MSIFNTIDFSTMTKFVPVQQTAASSFIGPVQPSSSNQQLHPDVIAAQKKLAEQYGIQTFDRSGNVTFDGSSLSTSKKKTTTSKKPTSVFNRPITLDQSVKQLQDSRAQTQSAPQVQLLPQARAEATSELVSDFREKQLNIAGPREVEQPRNIDEFAQQPFREPTQPQDTQPEQVFENERLAKLNLQKIRAEEDEEELERKLADIDDQMFSEANRLRAEAGNANVNLNNEAELLDLSNRYKALWAERQQTEQQLSGVSAQRERIDSLFSNAQVQEATKPDEKKTLSGIADFNPMEVGGQLSPVYIPPTSPEENAVVNNQAGTIVDPNFDLMDIAKGTPIENFGIPTTEGLDGSQTEEIDAINRGAQDMAADAEGLGEERILQDPIDEGLEGLGKTGETFANFFPSAQTAFAEESPQEPLPDRPITLDQVAQQEQELQQEEFDAPVQQEQPQGVEGLALTPEVQERIAEEQQRQEILDAMEQQKQEQVQQQPTSEPTVPGVPDVSGFSAKGQQILGAYDKFKEGEDVFDVVPTGETRAREGEFSNNIPSELFDPSVGVGSAYAGSQPVQTVILNPFKQQDDKKQEPIDFTTFAVGGIPVPEELQKPDINVPYKPGVSTQELYLKAQDKLGEQGYLQNKDGVEGFLAPSTLTPVQIRGVSRTGQQFVDERGVEIPQRFGGKEGDIISAIYARQASDRLENAKQREYVERLRAGEVSISDALLNPRTRNTYFKDGVKVSDGVPEETRKFIEQYFGERGISLDEQIGSVKLGPVKFSKDQINAARNLDPKDDKLSKEIQKSFNRYPGSFPKKYTERLIESNTIGLEGLSDDPALFRKSLDGKAVLADQEPTKAEIQEAQFRKVLSDVIENKGEQVYSLEKTQQDEINTYVDNLRTNPSTKAEQYVITYTDQSGNLNNMVVQGNNLNLEINNVLKSGQGFEGAVPFFSDSGLGTTPDAYMESVNKIREAQEAQEVIEKEAIKETVDKTGYDEVYPWMTSDEAVDEIHSSMKNETSKQSLPVGATALTLGAPALAFLMPSIFGTPSTKQGLQGPRQPRVPGSATGLATSVESGLPVQGSIGDFASFASLATLPSLGGDQTGGIVGSTPVPGVTTPQSVIDQQGIVTVPTQIPGSEFDLAPAPKGPEDITADPTQDPLGYLGQIGTQIKEGAENPYKNIVITGQGAVEGAAKGQVLEGIASKQMGETLLDRVIDAVGSGFSEEAGFKPLDMSEYMSGKDYSDSTILRKPNALEATSDFLLTGVALGGGAFNQMTEREPGSEGIIPRGALTIIPGGLALEQAVPGLAYETRFSRASAPAFNQLTKDVIKNPAFYIASGVSEAAGFIVPPLLAAKAVQYGGKGAYTTARALAIASYVTGGGGKGVGIIGRNVFKRGAPILYIEGAVSKIDPTKGITGGTKISDAARGVSVADLGKPAEQFALEDMAYTASKNWGSVETPIGVVTKKADELITRPAGIDTSQIGRQAQYASFLSSSDTIKNQLSDELRTFALTQKDKDIPIIKQADINQWDDEYASGVSEISTDKRIIEKLDDFKTTLPEDRQLKITNIVSDYQGVTNRLGIVGERELYYRDPLSTTTRSIYQPESIDTIVTDEITDPKTGAIIAPAVLGKPKPGVMPSVADIDYLRGTLSKREPTMKYVTTEKQDPITESIIGVWFKKQSPIFAKAFADVGDDATGFEKVLPAEEKTIGGAIKALDTLIDSSDAKKIKTRKIPETFDERQFASEFQPVSLKNELVLLRTKLRNISPDATRAKQDKIVNEVLDELDELTERSFIPKKVDDKPVPKAKIGSNKFDDLFDELEYVNKKIRQNRDRATVSSTRRTNLGKGKLDVVESGFTKEKQTAIHNELLKQQKSIQNKLDNIDSDNTKSVGDVTQLYPEDETAKITTRNLFRKVRDQLQGVKQPLRLADETVSVEEPKMYNFVFKNPIVTDIQKSGKINKKVTRSTRFELVSDNPDNVVDAWVTNVVTPTAKGRRTKSLVKLKPGQKPEDVNLEVDSKVHFILPPLSLGKDGGQGILQLPQKVGGAELYDNLPISNIIDDNKQLGPYVKILGRESKEQLGLTVGFGKTKNIVMDKLGTVPKTWTASVTRKADDLTFLKQYAKDNPEDFTERFGKSFNVEKYNPVDDDTAFVEINNILGNLNTPTRVSKIRRGKVAVMGYNVKVANSVKKKYGISKYGKISLRKGEELKKKLTKRKEDIIERRKNMLEIAHDDYYDKISKRVEDLVIEDDELFVGTPFKSIDDASKHLKDTRENQRLFILYHTLKSGGTNKEAMASTYSRLNEKIRLEGFQEPLLAMPESKVETTLRKYHREGYLDWDRQTGLYNITNKGENVINESEPLLSKGYTTVDIKRSVVDRNANLKAGVKEVDTDISVKLGDQLHTIEKFGSNYYEHNSSFIDNLQGWINTSGSRTREQLLGDMKQMVEMRAQKNLGYGSKEVISDYKRVKNELKMQNRMKDRIESGENTIEDFTNVSVLKKKEDKTILKNIKTKEDLTDAIADNEEKLTGLIYKFDRSNKFDKWDSIRNDPARFTEKQTKYNAKIADNNILRGANEEHTIRLQDLQKDLDNNNIAIRLHGSVEQDTAVPSLFKTFDGSPKSADQIQSEINILKRKANREGLKVEEVYDTDQGIYNKQWSVKDKVDVKEAKGAKDDLSRVQESVIPGKDPDQLFWERRRTELDTELNKLQTDRLKYTSGGSDMEVMKGNVKRYEESQGVKLANLKIQKEEFANQMETGKKRIVDINGEWKEIELTSFDETKAMYDSISDEIKQIQKSDGHRSYLRARDTVREFNDDNKELAKLDEKIDALSRTKEDINKRFTRFDFSRETKDSFDIAPMTEAKIPGVIGKDDPTKVVDKAKKLSLSKDEYSTQLNELQTQYDELNPMAKVVYEDEIKLRNLGKAKRVKTSAVDSLDEAINVLGFNKSEKSPFYKVVNDKKVTLGYDEMINGAYMRDKNGKIIYANNKPKRYPPRSPDGTWDNSMDKKAIRETEEILDVNKSVDAEEFGGGQYLFDPRNGSVVKAMDADDFVKTKNISVSLDEMKGTDFEGYTGTLKTVLDGDNKAEKAIAYVKLMRTKNDITNDIDSITTGIKQVRLNKRINKIESDDMSKQLSKVLNEVETVNPINESEFINLSRAYQNKPEFVNAFKTRHEIMKAKTEQNNIEMPLATLFQQSESDYFKIEKQLPRVISSVLYKTDRVRFINQNAKSVIDDFAKQDSSYKNINKEDIMRYMDGDTKGTEQVKNKIDNVLFELDNKYEPIKNAKISEILDTVRKADPVNYKIQYVKDDGALNILPKHQSNYKKFKTSNVNDEQLGNALLDITNDLKIKSADLDENRSKYLLDSIASIEGTADDLIERSGKIQTTRGNYRRVTDKIQRLRSEIEQDDIMSDDLKEFAYGIKPFEKTRKVLDDQQDSIMESMRTVKGDITENQTLIHQNNIEKKKLENEINRLVGGKEAKKVTRVGTYLQSDTDAFVSNDPAKLWIQNVERVQIKRPQSGISESGTKLGADEVDAYQIAVPEKTPAVRKFLKDAKREEIYIADAETLKVLSDTQEVRNLEELAGLARKDVSRGKFGKIGRAIKGDPEKEKTFGFGAVTEDDVQLNVAQEAIFTSLKNRTLTDDDRAITLLKVLDGKLDKGTLINIQTKNKGYTDALKELGVTRKFVNTHIPELDSAIRKGKSFTGKDKQFLTETVKVQNEITNLRGQLKNEIGLDDDQINKWMLHERFISMYNGDVGLAQINKKLEPLLAKRNKFYKVENKNVREKLKKGLITDGTEAEIKSLVEEKARLYKLGDTLKMSEAEITMTGKIQSGVDIRRKLFNLESEQNTLTSSYGLDGKKVTKDVSEYVKMSKSQQDSKLIKLYDKLDNVTKREETTIDALKDQISILKTQKENPKLKGLYTDFMRTTKNEKKVIDNLDEQITFFSTKTINPKERRVLEGITGKKNASVDDLIQYKKDQETMFTSKKDTIYNKIQTFTSKESKELTETDTRVVKGITGDKAGNVQALEKYLKQKKVEFKNKKNVINSDIDKFTKITEEQGGFKTTITKKYEPPKSFDAKDALKHFKQYEKYNDDASKALQKKEKMETELALLHKKYGVESDMKSLGSTDIDLATSTKVKKTDKRFDVADKQADSAFGVSDPRLAQKTSLQKLSIKEQKKLIDLRKKIKESQFTADELHQKADAQLQVAKIELYKSADEVKLRPIEDIKLDAQRITVDTRRKGVQSTIDKATIKQSGVDDKEPIFSTTLTDFLDEYTVKPRKPIKSFIDEPIDVPKDISQPQVTALTSERKISPELAKQQQEQLSLLESMRKKAGIAYQEAAKTQPKTTGRRIKDISIGATASAKRSKDIIGMFGTPFAEAYAETFEVKAPGAPQSPFDAPRVTTPQPKPKIDSQPSVGLDGVIPQREFSREASFTGIKLDPKVSVKPTTVTDQASRLIAPPKLDLFPRLDARVAITPKQRPKVKTDVIARTKPITRSVFAFPPRQQPRQDPILRPRFPVLPPPPFWLGAAKKKAKKKKPKKKKKAKLAWAVPDVWFGHWDPREYTVVKGSKNPFPTGNYGFDTE